MGLMTGKRGLVMGVANDHSIAWGIAKALHDAGAELAFTFQGEAFARRVKPLADSINSQIVLECDVATPGAVEATFAELAKQWPEIDFVVHAIAYSDKDELKGRYLDTTRANFAKTLSISCYSFTEVARASVPMLREGGSLLTLSYLGSQRVTPNYNVMGVAKAALEASVRYLAMNLGPEGTRVNAVSAGPIKTLAASGVGNLRKMLTHVAEQAPLRRNVTIEDVGNVGAFLCSDLAAGVTGEVTYVDCGYNILGMTGLD